MLCLGKFEGQRVFLSRDCGHMIGLMLQKVTLINKGNGGKICVKIQEKRGARSAWHITCDTGGVKNDSIYNFLMRYYGLFRSQ